MPKIHLNDLPISRPSKTDYLTTYNTTLGQIYSDYFSQRAHRMAPTLNRLEAQTHFYEILELYIQSSDYLKNNLTHTLVIDWTPHHHLLIGFLRRSFSGRINIDFPSIKSRILYRFSHLPGLTLILLTVRLMRRLFHYVQLIYRHRHDMKLSDIETPIETIMLSYFDHRNFTDDGELRDEYFGQFAHDMGAYSNTLILYKFLNPSLYDDYRQAKRPPYHTSSYYRHIRVSSIISTFFMYIYDYFRLFFCAQKNTYTYKSVSLYPFILASIRYDYLLLRPLWNYIEHLICSRIMPLNPKRLYFPYENQTWEKLYPHFKATHPSCNTHIIGYQHSGMSHKILNYFPATPDASLPIFPDTIITVGRLFYDYLQTHAHYPSRLIEGAALRFMKHQFPGADHFTVRQLGSSDLKRAIVYAFSYDIDKYPAIIRTLLHTFSDPSITVYLRFHPICSKSVLRAVLPDSFPNHFISAHHLTWLDIYKRVDCVLYDDNSVGIECLMYGLKSYYLDVAERIYDCTRFFDFDLWPSILDPPALVQLRDQLKNGQYDPIIDIRAVEKYINTYYTCYRRSIHFDQFLCVGE